MNEIEKLAGDVLVATNEGTYGAEECCRVTGSGDPMHGNWRTYERLDGSRYTIGRDPSNAPGRARYIGHESAASRRAKLASLRAAIAASAAAQYSEERRREELLRGWDGYQYVGAAEGQRRAAATE